MNIYGTFTDVCGVKYKEITITADTLFRYSDNKYIAPLTEIFKDDDCLKEITVTVQTMGYKLCFSYDNAVIEIILYNPEFSDKFDRKLDVHINCRGRVSSYIFELQNDLCDYVLWLDEQEWEVDDAFTGTGKKAFRPR